MLRAAVVNKSVAKRGVEGYTLGHMPEEPEDYNAFGKWDAVGAAAMLGVFPAVLNFIFNDHDIPGTISLMSISVIAGLAVYIAGLVVDGKSLGRIVNYVGIALTPVYAIIAFFMWDEATDKLFPSEETQQVQPANQTEGEATQQQAQ